MQLETLPRREKRSSKSRSRTYLFTLPTSESIRYEEQQTQWNAVQRLTDIKAAVAIGAIAARTFVHVSASEKRGGEQRRVGFWKVARCTSIPLASSSLCVQISLLRNVFVGRRTRSRFGFFRRRAKVYSQWKWREAGGPRYTYGWSRPNWRIRRSIKIGCFERWQHSCSRNVPA